MNLSMIVIAIVASIGATVAFPQDLSGVPLAPEGALDQGSLDVPMEQNEELDVQTEQTIIPIELTTIAVPVVAVEENIPMPANAESPTSAVEGIIQPEQAVPQAVDTSQTITEAAQSEQIVTEAVQILDQTVTEAVQTGDKIITEAVQTDQALTEAAQTGNIVTEAVPTLDQTVTKAVETVDQTIITETVQTVDQTVTEVVQTVDQIVVTEAAPITEAITQTIPQVDQTVTQAIPLIETVTQAPSKQAENKPFNVILTKGISRNCFDCMSESIAFWQIPPYGTHYYGKFHITQEYWINAGNKTVAHENPKAQSAWKQCAENDSCAEESIRSYMNKYYHDCDGNGVIDCHDYLQIHMHGPGACRNKTVDRNIEDTLKFCFRNKH